MTAHKLRDHAAYLAAAAAPGAGDSICGKGTPADVFMSAIPPAEFRHLEAHNLCPACWKVELDAEAQIVADAKAAEEKRRADHTAHLEALDRSRAHAAAVLAENERRAAEQVIAQAKAEEERKAQAAKEAEARAAERQALLDRVAALEAKAGVQP